MEIIITTNSPGEVSAWVRPMVKAFKQRWFDAKITVFIPPCTFASGREVPVVASFPEVDLVIGPMQYLKYVIFRHKPKGFKPEKEGFVLFLGGDLGHATQLGKRLNFPVYAYTERDAGHAETIELFFIPTEKVAKRLERKGVPSEKICLVGDLMLAAIKPTLTKKEMYDQLEIDQNKFLINLLPGSRPKEVAESLPFLLKTLMSLLKTRPEIQPIITLAPFITLKNITNFLQKKELPWQIEDSENEAILKLRIEEHLFHIYRGNSYNTMQISNLAVSLPGTNNVELAALKIPTLVILPLNWPELIPLPGIAGMVGDIPFLGGLFKKRVVIPKLLPKFKYVSPVNRNRDQLIFPELIGILNEKIIAERILTVIDDELTEINNLLDDFNIDDQAPEKIITNIALNLPSSLENKHG